VSRPPPAAVLAAAVIGALVVAAVFLLYAGETGTGPADADPAVLTGFLDVRAAGLTTVVVALTTIGSTAAMAVVAAAVSLALWLRRMRVDALFLAATAAGASIVFRLLKSVLDRPRPPEVDRLVNETNESLPSGHATMSVAVLGALLVLVWGWCGVRARAWLVAAVVVWVGAVGASRLYLGVHWFSDVLAGWLVGAAWLAVCVAGRAWAQRRAAEHHAAADG